MEIKDLEPQVLLIGSDLYQQKIYPVTFQQAGIRLITQKLDKNIEDILKKYSIDIFIIKSKCFDRSLKPLLSKLHYFFPHAGLLLILGQGQDNEKNRILALEIGVDECFGQDVSLQELYAKIHSLHRRLFFNANSDKDKKMYFFQGYTVDLQNREIRNTENKAINNLTSGEFSLLKIFLEHPNHLLTRNFLLNKTTKYNEYSCSRSVDILVSRLRKKMKLSNVIRTVYGEGYIFHY
jgi:DNA-binding response OmpR family regulator